MERRLKSYCTSLTPQRQDGVGQREGGAKEKGSGSVKRNVFVFDHVQNMNFQNPRHRPPTPASPAAVAEPRRLAQPWPAGARGKAWRSSARLGRQRAGGGWARPPAGRRVGGARWGNPCRALTSPQRWPMRSRTGGFPLRLPLLRLFKWYPGECTL